jgi:thymidylate kinase
VARRVTALLPEAVGDAQYRARRAIRKAARTWAVYRFAWRGDIVLCDRHPLEVLATDADRRTLGGAVERWVTRRLVPWPDAVVLLDAPGDVLFARKGEHSPAELEAQRRAFRSVFGARDATVVATTGGLERTVAEASRVLWRALRERRGW